MVMADLRFGIIGWGYWGPKIARKGKAIWQRYEMLIATIGRPLFSSTQEETRDEKL